MNGIVLPWSVICVDDDVCLSVDSVVGVVVKIARRRENVCMCVGSVSVLLGCV